MCKKYFSLSLILAFILPSSAFATVIGGDLTGGSAVSAGGVFEILNPPPAAVGDNDQQNPNLSAFNEDQNILITSTINVDIGIAPISGDVVASHYIIFDPISTKRGIGYIDFDAPIYGIITSTALLAASDFLINNAVTYNSPGLRGLEAGDVATIDGTLSHRVNIDFTASTPGDYIRVLTMRSPIADQIPEPGLLGIFGLGLLGMIGLRQRRRL